MMNMLSRDAFPTQTEDDYGTIRATIKSGDLLLCSGNIAVSRMIQSATDSVWSHVALLMHIKEIDRVMVLESVESVGVRTIALSKYMKNYNNKNKGYDGRMVVARHNGITTGNFDQAMFKTFAQHAVDMFGYPYDRAEVGRIIARIVGSKLGFGRRELRTLKRNKEYICSEYVEECFNAIGIQIRHNPNGFVTPADFASDPSVSLVGVLKN